MNSSINQKKQTEPINNTLFDPLTKLYNEDFFHEILYKEFVFQQRDEEYSFSLIYLECIHMAQITQQYGQESHNHIINKVAEFISTHIRTSDYGFRFENNTFAVILKNAKRHIARKIAKKIAIDFNSYSFIFEHDSIVHINLNIGITEQSHITSHQEIDDLINSVKEELYRSKEVRDT